jgi:hypothetical protein
LVLGIAAAGAVAAYVLTLDRRNQAEQLLEILAGKSVPDAAWAFARLAEIGDEDLRVLSGHVDDSRVTPLELIFEGHASSTDSNTKLTIGTLARRFLVSRTFVGRYNLGDFRAAEPENWDGHDWSNEVERFLLTHERLHGGYVEPTTPKRSWLGGLRESPPTWPASAFSLVCRENTERVVNALCGDDAARSIWFFETLRRAPGETLDGFVGHVLSPKRTKVCHFCGKLDSARRSEGFALGRLVQLLLSERVGDPRLHYSAMRAAEYDLPDQPQLAAKVEAAWRAFRAKGMSLK